MGTQTVDTPLATMSTSGDSAPTSILYFETVWTDLRKTVDLGVPFKLNYTVSSTPELVDASTTQRTLSLVLLWTSENFGVPLTLTTAEVMTVACEY